MRQRILITIILFTLLIPPTLNIRVAGVSWPIFYWLIIIFCGILLSLSGVYKRLWPIFLFLIPLYGIVQPLQYGGNSRLYVVLPGLAFISLLAATLIVRPDKNILTRYIIFLSIPIHIIAILQGVTHTWPIIDSISLSEFTSSAYFGRAGGTLGHPIAYGTLAGVTILLAFTSNIDYRVKSIAVGTGFAGLLMSGSRSALIPIGILFILLFGRIIIRWINRPIISRVGVLRTGILFTILGPVLVVGFMAINRADTSRYSNIQESFSYQYRTMQWSAAWKIINSNRETLIWGRGAGASTELLARQRLIQLWGPKTFDNSFVTLTFDYGILGLSFIVLTFIILIFYGQKNSLSGRVVLAFLFVNGIFFDAFLWPSFLSLVIASILMVIPSEGSFSRRNKTLRLSFGGIKDIGGVN